MPKMADKLKGRNIPSSNEEFQKAGGGHFNNKTQGYHSKLSQLLNFVILLQLFILIVFLLYLLYLYIVILYLINLINLYYINVKSNYCKSVHVF